MEIDVWAGLFFGMWSSMSTLNEGVLYLERGVELIQNKSTAKDTANVKIPSFIIILFLVLSNLFCISALHDQL
jgi:hypothetical protein